MPAGPRRYHRSVLFLGVADYLTLVGSFGLALRFRHYNFGLNIIDLTHLNLAPSAAFVFLYAGIMLLVFSALSLYRRKVWLNPSWHAIQIVKGSLILAGVYLLLVSLLKGVDFLVPSRLVMLKWFALMFLSLLFIRIILFPRLVQWAGRRAALQRRVVLVGDSREGMELVRRWRQAERTSLLHLVGQISDIPPEQRQVKDLPNLGSLDQLPDLVSLYNLEGAVIMVSPALTHERLIALIEQCVLLFGWVDVHTEKSTALHGEEAVSDVYFNVPFARFGRQRQDLSYQLAKRFMDLAGAMAGVVLLAPVFIAVAIAVKVSSPGPVFYVHNRVGLRGVPFRFFKFRSMTVGADQDPSRQKELAEHIRDGNQAAVKIINPSYVTPVGGFLRKWALDELPQLFNVIRGDMSLVGPRPIPPSEYELNEAWQKGRFDIKPGCTGLWKLRASSESMSYNELALYDLYYARNASLVLDIYVLINTVRVVLGGRADV